MESQEIIKQILIKRALCKKSLKFFLLEKWKEYNKATFLDSWHFDYLCSILEATIPQNPQNLQHNAQGIQGDKDASFSTQRDTQDILSNAYPITRLMLNMPPSYGKTELIARTFIAWALGNNPQRKFIYISYSDDLCKKISNQVRDLIKSNFFTKIFGKLEFLQDNSSEFVLKSGGGLFVTTLKSAITGFHAHQILIDDPIKVSEMNSAAARKLVNQNFKESVLSRLQDNQSNITILMQRLGDDDLCGFLLNERHFEKDIINQWKVIKLQAINQKQETYKMGSFEYTREAKSALFDKRHSVADLEHLKLQMGEDEFSTQYQQEPQAREAGFFESSYFKRIPSYEVGNTNDYIFVDNATSLNQSSDNRAIVCIGIERVEKLDRYIVKDCLFGIWSEEQTIENLIDTMLLYPSAKVYIESEAGGATLHRLLQKEVILINQGLKQKGKNLISNSMECYTPSRKISKVEKIKAMRSYYNTGYLVFLNSARGLSQIETELLAFNPQKPFRKDDCIDCIASCISHNDTYGAVQTTQNLESKSGIDKLRSQDIQRLSYAANSYCRWNI